MYIKENNEYQIHYTGYIDNSLSSYNQKTNILKVYAYDALYLCNKFADAKTLFSHTAGYTASIILGMFFNRIDTEGHYQHFIDADYSIPVIDENNVEIMNIDYNSFAQKCNQPPKEPIGEIYEENLPWTSMRDYRIGFVYGHVLQIVLLAIVKWECGVGSFQRTYVAISGRVYSVYNGLCPEYDKENDFFIDYGWFNQMQEEGEQWVRAKASAWLSVYGMGLGDTFAHNTIYQSKVYNLTEQADGNYLLTASGNMLPDRIYPRGFFDGDNTPEVFLNILKTMTLMYNISLSCASDGRIKMHSRDRVAGSELVIEDASIIEKKLSRLGGQAPGVKVLEYLCGDVLVLQELLIGMYATIFTNKNKLILTSYMDQEISLFSRITVGGVSYRVVEVLSTINTQNKYLHNIVAWEE